MTQPLLGLQRQPAAPPVISPRLRDKQEEDLKSSFLSHTLHDKIEHIKFSIGISLQEAPTAVKQEVAQVLSLCPSLRHLIEQQVGSPLVGLTPEFEKLMESFKTAQASLNRNPASHPFHTNLLQFFQYSRSFQLELENYKKIHTDGKGSLADIQSRVDNMVRELGVLVKRPSLQLRASLSSQLKDLESAYCEVLENEVAKKSLTQLHESFYATLFCPDMGLRLLSKEKFKEMLPVGTNGKLVGNNEEGIHSVIQWKKSFIKENPSYQGIEFSYYSFAHTLFGRGAPPTLLIKVACGSQTTIVQASKGVDGESLEHFLRPSKEWEARYSSNRLQLLEEKLDRVSTSQLVLLHILTRPHDAKTDNFTITFDKEQDKYILTPIDNDDSFAHPFFKKGNDHFVHIRSFLFCLKGFMNTQIPPEVRKSICELNPAQFVFEWLKDLHEHNQRIEDFIQQGYFSIDEFRLREIQPLALMLPKEALIIYSYLCKMQQALKEDKHLTHMELLKKVFPEVGLYYAAVSQKIGTAPDVFYYIAKEQASIERYLGSRIDDIQVDDSDPHHLPVRMTLREYISHPSRQHGRDAFVELRNHTPRMEAEGFMRSFSFKSCINLHVQRTVVDLTLALPLEEYTFRNCDVLTNKDIYSLIEKNKRVSTLRFRNCPLITLDLIPFILKNRPAGLKVFSDFALAEAQRKNYVSAHGAPEDFVRIFPQFAEKMLFSENSVFFHRESAHRPPTTEKTHSNLHVDKELGRVSAFLRQNRVDEALRLMETISPEFSAEVQYYLETELESPSLHKMVEIGSLSWVKIFVSREGLLTEKNSAGQTPLHLAARLNKESIVQELAKYPDLDALDPEQRTPLMYACRAGAVESALALIQAGSNLNLKDLRENTPLRIVLSTDEGDPSDRTKIALQLLKVNPSSAYYIPDNAQIRTNNLQLCFMQNLPEVARELLKTHARLAQGDPSNPELPIHTAVTHLPEESFIKDILFFNKDHINKQNREGRTPLMLAASHANESLVKLFIERGARLDLMDVEGMRVQHHSVLAGCSSSFARILRALPAEEVFLPTHAGKTILDLAALNCLRLSSKENFFKIMGMLLADAPADSIQKWFIKAVQEEQWELARLLRERAQPQLAMDNGLTLLHWAAENKKVAVIDFLCKELECRANTLVENGLLPLMCGIMSGDVQTLTTLIAYGAEPHRTYNKESMTPLHFAANHSDNWTALSVLLNKSPQPEMNTKLGSVLHFAVKKNHLHMVQESLIFFRQRNEINLAKREATPQINESAFPFLEQIDDEGNTALHLAVAKSKPKEDSECRRQLEILKLLLAQEPRVNAANHRGETPLFIAVKFRRKEFVDTLRVAWANPTFKSGGLTPIDYAKGEKERIEKEVGRDSLKGRVLRKATHKPPPPRNDDLESHLEEWSEIITILEREAKCFR